jgi:tRNA-uridine 2-sulfurtransferase
MGVDAAGRRVLMRGVDHQKDQAYFLWSLPPALLPQLMFPLGELTKPEVRERARALGLATAEKPESQEICFVPTGDYVDVLEARLGAGHPALAPGTFVTPSGEAVGEHAGFARYTVGQRKGLGGGHGRRLYVLGSRPATREVVVGSWDELHRDEVRIGETNWLADPPASGAAVKVQIRHRAAAAAARVVSREGDAVELRFDVPQRAVAPGQSAVVFDGEVVLGGGRIAA